MLEHEQKLAIARSYEQIEKSLAFTDFRGWVREEVEIRESELRGLTPEKKHLFEAYFLRWQAWKELEASIGQHIVLAKETVKENQDAGEPDSPYYPAASSSAPLIGY